VAVVRGGPQCLLTRVAKAHLLAQVTSTLIRAAANGWQWQSYVSEDALRHLAHSPRIVQNRYEISKEIWLTDNGCGRDESPALAGGTTSLERNWIHGRAAQCFPPSTTPRYSSAARPLCSASMPDINEGKPWSTVDDEDLQRAISRGETVD
jgi:hypothetical protein